MNPIQARASTIAWRRLFPVGLLLAALLGGIVGLGGFTFLYAHGPSYLTDDPAACANCHVMREVYAAWNASSHKAVAVCNDCHTPHTSLAAKYAIKALDGVRHSAAFTLGHFPEPIRIGGMDREIALGNCRRCHAEVTSLIDHAGGGEKALDCLHCHSRVGHDE
jgi:cytochrome c nitrite reductase small subunit